MNKNESRLYKLILIFIVSMALCFFLNWHTTGQADSYLTKAHVNRLNQDEFQYHSIDRGIRSLGDMEIANSRASQAIIDFVLWSKTNNQTVFEQGIEFFQDINLTEAINLTKEMNEYQAIAKQYGRDALSNESAALQINSGLSLMNLAPLFFSMTFVPLSLDEKRKEKFFTFGVKLSIIIFALGLSIWFLSFISIFNLIF